MRVRPFGPHPFLVAARVPLRDRLGRGVPVVAAATVALGLLHADPVSPPAQEPGAVSAAEPACQFRASGDRLVERLSPPDSSSVRLGDGTAKVCYGSPRARDRQIMGGLVPFGEPWRLGANEPTTLHVTVPARVGDVRLEAGSYSLYSVPGPERWEIVVNAATDRWGVPIDASVRRHDLATVTVPADSTEEYVEALSIELRPAGEEAAEMVVTWERTRVSVPLRPGGS